MRLMSHSIFFLNKFFEIMTLSKVLILNTDILGTSNLTI